MRPGAAPLPVLALGGALVLWGWQNQLLVFAIPMAIALESARWVPWRWRLADRDFHRIADLSGIVLLLVIAYQFDANAVRVEVKDRAVGYLEPDRAVMFREDLGDSQWWGVPFRCKGRISRAETGHLRLWLDSSHDWRPKVIDGDPLSPSYRSP